MFYCVFVMCCICVRWRRFQVECSSAAKLIYTPWHNLSLQRGCFSFWAKLNQFHFPTTQVCMNEISVFWLVEKRTEQLLFGVQKSAWANKHSPFCHEKNFSACTMNLWTSPICISEITFGFSQSAGYEKQCITCIFR